MSDSRNSEQLSTAEKEKPNMTKDIATVDDLLDKTSNFEPGTILSLKPGVYRINDPIVLSNDITFIGQGDTNESVNIVCDNPSAFIIDSGDVRFKNVTIQANPKVVPPDEDLVKGTLLLRKGQLQVSNSKILAQSVPCVHITGSESNAAIEKTDLKNGSSGVVVDKKGNAKVSQCNIVDTKINGVIIVDGSQLIIDKTTIRGGQHGIVAFIGTGEEPSATITDCQLNGITDAALLLQGGKIICENTLVSLCKEFGILFVPDRIRSVGHFTNCEFFNNYNTNILLRDCSVEFNDCRIRCTNEFLETRINDARRNHDRPIGVEIVENCEIIMDRCVFDFPGFGAKFHETEPSQYGCLFRECKFFQHETAILLGSNAESTQDVSSFLPKLDSYGVFEKCEIANFRNSAVQSLSRDSRILFKDCHIHDGGGQGGFDENSSSGISFIGQDFDGPKGTIENCRFENVKGLAIEIGSAADVTVCKSHIDGAVAGIVVDTSTMCRVDDCSIQNIKFIGIVMNSEKACEFRRNKISNCGREAWQLGPNTINTIREDNDPNE